jgi:hypothetical protein
MKRSITLAAALAVVIGCATMPDPVSTVYLSEKTPAESQAIDKLELAVVAKKNEKESAEKELRIIEQRVKAASADLNAVSARGKALEEESRLVSLTEDAGRAAEIAKKIEQNGRVRTHRDKKHEKEKAAKQHGGALVDLRQAELAALVAELDMEKAKIAHVYQEKRPDQYKKDLKFWERIYAGTPLIDVGPYERYHRDRKNREEEARKKLAESEKALREAENALRMAEALLER